MYVCKGNGNLFQSVSTRSCVHKAWCCSGVSSAVGLAVLHLRESGALATLAKKWWQDKGECVGDDQKVRSQLSFISRSGLQYTF